MSELSKKTVAAAPSVAGAKAPTGNPVAVAGHPGHSNPLAAAGHSASAQPVAVAVAASQPPAAFGGHRGGGKKRADGLVAGSPEALEADKQRDRDRKNAANAAKKIAALPPPLPSVGATGANAVAPLAGDPNALPVPVAGAPVAPVAITFVAWTEKVLARPIKLLTKIGDRFRVAARMKRVRKLELQPEQEKEIERDLHFKEEALNDFNAALANAATIELNKRRVSGAANSHWLDLLMTGGELVATDMAVADKIEQMIIDNELKKKAALEPEKK